MLGVDGHGGFAEFLTVPAATVYRLPDTVPLKSGAYAEPVAASLAVLKAGLCPNERGLLYGNNRIALLTRDILSIYGFGDLTLWDPDNERSELGGEKYDFAIETLATKESLHDLIRAVRPRGKIVLKSRPYHPVPLDVRTAVLKELTLQAVNYGSFDEAIALLDGGLHRFDELLGKVYRLEEFERAFAASECNETTKSFLGLIDDAEMPA
jgi:L-iditol 2-dehydrogenase